MQATILKWLNWGEERADRRHGTKARRAVRTRRLAVEGLERRELLAANVFTEGTIGNPDFWKAGDWVQTSSVSWTSSALSNPRSSSAGWNLAVEPGIYTVGVGWEAASWLSGNAWFYVWDGDTLLRAVSIDQRQTPNDIVGDTAGNFELLAAAQVTGRQLRITTWNAAGQVSLTNIYVTNVGWLDDKDPSVFNSVGFTAPHDSGMITSGRTSNTTIGSGNSFASWSLPVAPGVYDVSVTWPSYMDLATRTPFYLWDGDALQQLVWVEQNHVFRDFSENGGTWEHLGVIRSTRGSVRVTTWNRTDGNIEVDAVRISPRGILDDADAAGFTAVGFTQPGSTAFAESSRTSNTSPGSGQSVASWSIPVVPGVYDVAITWDPSASPNLATNAPFYLWDGGRLVRYVTVDQRNASFDFSAEIGSAWKHLGPVNIRGNELRITTWNGGTDGQVAADAVRIASGGLIDNSDPQGFMKSGPWTTQTPPASIFGSLLESDTSGSGGSVAYWGFDLSPGVYEVSATWWPNSQTLATNTPFYLWDGNRLASWTAVNQKVEPANYLGDYISSGLGAYWQTLGLVSLRGNRLDVSTWNKGVNGKISVDAIRVRKVGALVTEPSDGAACAGEPLTEDRLRSLVPAAIADLAGSLSADQRAALGGVEWVVADLPEGVLGLADGRRIYLDRDAAGRGWFVDRTPEADEEFTRGPNRGATAVDPRAVDRIDLLTVLEHELGHLVGRTDLDGAVDDLMSGRLAAGIRRR